MTRARDIASNGGTTLITKTDFTSASTINVLNCFSPTYTNYQMMVNLTGASLANYTLLQFLSGSTPATSGYYFAYNGYTSAAGNFPGAGSNQASAYFLEYNSSLIGVSHSSMIIQNPNKVMSTSFANTISWDNTAGVYVARVGGGAHYTAAAYDGIRILTNSGTISGTVRIYGIKD